MAPIGSVLHRFLKNDITFNIQNMLLNKVVTVYGWTTRNMEAKTM